MVKLKWYRIGQHREFVSIDFPGTEIVPDQRNDVGCNVRLTFRRCVKGGREWVEVAERQPINPNIQCVDHVSKHVFYGMAQWACAILCSFRVLLSDGTLITVPPKSICWNVYWQADDGKHWLGWAWAICERDACIITAQSDIMFDSMYAIPVKKRQVRLGGTAT